MSKNEHSGDTVHRYIPLDAVDDLRDAAHNRDLRYDSLGRRLRDEAIVACAIDFGLRVSELRSLKRPMFRLDDEELMLPGHIQKDYPIEGESPSSATLRIDPYGHFGTTRLLRSYFQSEWWQNRDGKHVFPSRQSKQITTESLRNTIEDLAVEADVTVYQTDGESPDPSELHPHALRHSLANYMLADEDTRLVDVRNRLRHRSITTTERVYEHFQRR